MNIDRYSKLLLITYLLAFVNIAHARSLADIVKNGVEIKRYCRYYDTQKESKYPQWFQKDEARKTIASNLQYFLINQTIKDMSELAHANKLSSYEFSRVTQSLVRQSCSANLTMIRPKDIIKLFSESYEELNGSNQPAASNSKFQDSLSSREKLGVSINRFKQVCSWDGRIENYRMLSWYLSDHFVFAELIKNLSKNEKAILCKKDYCHVVSKDKFLDEYPLAAGSLNWQEDYRSTYCSHFRFQTHDHREQPAIIKKWINEFFGNRTIYLSHLLSHLAQEPLDIKRDGTLSWSDLFTNYAELINNSWKDKAKSELESKVGYFAHEEPLLLIPIEKENTYRKQVVKERLNLDIMVTAGEIDKGLKTYNKLSAQIEIKFPDSFFHWVKRSFSHTTIEQKIEHSNLRKKLRDYYNKALESEYKHFAKGPWRNQLPEVLVDETVKILLASRFADKNTATSKKWKYVNIKLHFGLFALKHLYEMGPVSGVEGEGIKFTKTKFAL